MGVPGYNIQMEVEFFILFYILKKVLAYNNLGFKMIT